MKRKRIIFSAVLLVVIVLCIAPWWWEIWLAVAYEKRSEEGAQYLAKRYSWVPGSQFLIEPQRCQHCDAQEHDNCLNMWIVFTLRDNFQVLPYQSDGKHAFKGVALKPGESGSDTKISEVPCTCPTCHPERER